MASRSEREIAAAAQVFFRLPLAAKVALVALIAAAVIFVYLTSKPGRTGQQQAQQPAPPGALVLMFWNVENLFDDRDDNRNSIDEPYDDWFAKDAESRRLKYEHLAKIILQVNGGKGPDVFAGVEVESLRAAELLRDELNAHLPEGTEKYEHVAMKELSPSAGRYIAPCLISRYSLDADHTRLLGTKNLRILETRLNGNQADLTLIVSHWTSQRSDSGGRKGRGRHRYATTIYEEYQKIMEANPDADFLVCGDFNTPPDSRSVAQELFMTGQRDDVSPTRTNPRLFGLLSNKSPEQFGTHYYSKPLIYDQVGISPGMLDDKGWSCDPDSVAVPTDGMIRDRSRVRRPWRFGDEKDNARGRGYSDHFPVVVQLSYHAN